MFFFHKWCYFDCIYASSLQELVGILAWIGDFDGLPNSLEVDFETILVWQIEA